MIDHMSVKVTDLTFSKGFYQKVLHPLGYVLRFDNESAVSFKEPNGNDPAGDFWLETGKSSRTHFAFSAPDHESVELFYKAALKAGGVDNGAPGLRPHYHPDYYAAFILDPDGYNIEAVCHHN